MEENEDEGGNWYWVYSANSCSSNNQNAINFRWSGVQDEDEEDIALVNFIENYKSKLMRNFFQKKLLDDYGIVPNEKKI